MPVTKTSTATLPGVAAPAAELPAREPPVQESSDASILDLLRQFGPLGVTDLAHRMGVTATAVRQRLTRLMSRDLIQRTAQRAGRGRPSHRYWLTKKGQRDTGTNYGDLASVLWKEMRAIQDPQVRRGLLQRIATGMATAYESQSEGRTLTERMQSLSGLMGERNIPFAVDESGELPVLTALACPYPDLAEQDRGVCAMERMLFSEVLGQSVKLTDCRLDGATCCTFEAG